MATSSCSRIRACPTTRRSRISRITGAWAGNAMRSKLKVRLLRSICLSPPRRPETMGRPETTKPTGQSRCCTKDLSVSLNTMRWASLQRPIAWWASSTHAKLTPAAWSWHRTMCQISGSVSLCCRSS
ncbi:hypothetical protein AZA_64282 [Nitrospirillum viridazoti Y2]|nr:hypothetical protein AZA_64282 [Nitrospirillum amazonense Y2]